MSNKRDPAISVSSETKHDDVVIRVDDLSSEDDPVNKNTSPSIESPSIESPSIESISVNHTEVPTQPADNGHRSNSDIAQSTTVFDIDDGVGTATKEILSKTYKKIWENFCLGLMIAVICGISLTPVIMYYTRPDFKNPFSFDTVQSSSCQEVSSVVMLSYINIHDS